MVCSHPSDLILRLLIQYVESCPVRSGASSTQSFHFLPATKMHISTTLRIDVESSGPTLYICPSSPFSMTVMMALDRSSVCRYDLRATPPPCNSILRPARHDTSVFGMMR